MAIKTWQDRIVERPRTFTIQNNADGTVTLIPAPGTIVQDGTPVNATALNELENRVGSVVEIYPTTNVGNAYTVTIPNLTALTNGYPICVQFNAVSTGAITVNPNNLGDISVVDYFGNPVNNVRANLIANLRYNSTNGNFQLQGKGGGGNATPDQLLNSIAATVDKGPIVGTMPNKIGSNTVITPSTTDQIIAKGYYDGTSTSGKIKGDPNLIPSNIILGASIFNITGNVFVYNLAAGGNTLLNANTYKATFNTSPQKIKEMKVLVNGVVRVSFQIKSYYAPKNVYGQIYINGVAKGQLRTNNTNSYVTYTEDFTVNRNDLVQLYTWSQDSSSENDFFNMTLNVDLSNIATVTLDS